MPTSRTLAFSLAAALVASTAAPVLAQAVKPSDLVYPKLPAFTVPKPVRFVLPNGMVVMVMEDHELPLVNVVARIRTGSLLEPAAKTGLASLTGQVLRSGGTTSLKPDELDEFLEGRAASIETGIGADSGSASMSALKADAPAVLKVFADVLRRPAFDPDRLKIAVTGVTAAIARQNDSPNGILSREFAQVIYGDDSPFARSTTYASIAAITRDDLVAWHAKYYHPNRIVLGIVGDIGVEEAKKLVTEQFGDWAKTAAPLEPMPTPKTEPSPGVFEAVKADSTQSFVSVGHQGSLLRTSPDYFAVTVLNEVLSGGFTSRLFAKVRTELGLAYSVGGSVGSGWTRVAPFSMTMSTKVDSTAKAIEALIGEAKALGAARPPTDAEVALAKSSILNSFVFNSDSAAEVLGQQMTYEYYGQPLDWLDRYRAAIDKVTTTEVAAVAAKYLHPDRLSIVVVGPSEGRDKPLSTLGPVKALDISIPEPPSARPSAASTPEAAKQGRALVEKAVTGFGGAAKLDGLTSYVERGAVVMKGPQGEMEIKAARIVALPNRVRQELTMPMGTMVLVVTPEAAFGVTPQGERPLPPPMRERVEKDLLRSPVFLLRQRGQAGFTATAVGPAKSGDTAIEQVSVQFGGETVTLGVDMSTGRVLTVAYRGDGPSGAPGDIAETFSDFRDTGGLLLPFRSVSTFNGEPSGGSTTDTITVNGPVDAKQFARTTTP
jgi:predicted Zn-dependent peptidase